MVVMHHPIRVDETQGESQETNILFREPNGGGRMSRNVGRSPDRCRLDVLPAIQCGEVSATCLSEKLYESTSLVRPD